MINRIFFLIPLLVLTISCSGFEFVYNPSFVINNKMNNNTLFSISGDNKDIINSYLLNKIGKAEKNPNYALSIVSDNVIEATVIETDATASKFIIKHNIKYTLSNVKKNCVIFEKNILTSNLYDAKSAGYSFGTDLAEKELSTKNLHSNIDQFLNELSINYNNLKCKNEG
jgi:hypothetical protein